MKIPVHQKQNPSSLFVGRKDLLDKLRKIFIHYADSRLMSRGYCLLYGAGGIGKTQICLKFIEEISREYRRLHDPHGSKSQAGWGAGASAGLKICACGKPAPVARAAWARKPFITFNIPLVLLCFLFFSSILSIFFFLILLVLVYFRHT